MKSPRPFPAFATLHATGLAALITLACAAAASAGQVRVNASGFAFSPADVTLSQGDHVVWVWTGGSHTVTSGDLNTVPNTNVGDGKFNSGLPALPPLSTFSWKSDMTGTEPYYCIPHLPGMAGTLTMLASGASVADFRITEVQFNTAGSLDLVEISNLGAAGDLGMYRLSVNGGAAQTMKKAGSTAASTDIVVPGGGRVVVHCNASGTTTDSDIYLTGIADLPASGSAALYVPNVVNTALTLADQMIDFVQWGAGGQGNEATAVTAGFWNAGAAITGVADGHSIEFCGQPGQYGASFWHEVSPPNFGSYDNCTTPAFRTTWGRIKTLYR
jgi:plastocyanin